MRFSLFLSPEGDAGVPTIPPPMQAPTAIEAAVAAARTSIAERAAQAPSPTVIVPASEPAAVTPASEGAALSDSSAQSGAVPQGTDWAAVDWATFDIPAAELADPTLFFLPPRAPGQPPIPVVLNQPELVDDLRRFRNDGMRGAEYAEAQAELREREERLQDTIVGLRADPVNFILQNVDPEVQTRVAMTILTHREVWSNMVNTLKALIANPAQLENTRARLENMNLKAERDGAQLVERERAARQNGADLRRAVHALVPRNLSREQAKLWRDAARATLREYAQRQNLVTIDVRDVPSILAPHLSAYNVAPETAWAQMRSAFMGGSTAPQSPAPMTASAPTTARPGVQTPRQAAAMIAPAGAGAPAATLPTPPKGQGISERLEWLKANAGVLRRA